MRKRLDNIGLRVSDTKPDTRIAVPMVTANSWNSRPRIPPMKSSGMKTAVNEMVIASGCGLRDGVVVDVEAGHLY